MSIISAYLEEAERRKKARPHRIRLAYRSSKSQARPDEFCIICRENKRDTSNPRESSYCTECKSKKRAARYQRHKKLHDYFNSFVKEA